MKLSKGSQHNDARVCGCVTRHFRVFLVAMKCNLRGTQLTQDYDEINDRHLERCKAHEERERTINVLPVIVLRVKVCASFCGVLTRLQEERVLNRLG